MVGGVTRMNWSLEAVLGNRLLILFFILKFSPICSGQLILTFFFFWIYATIVQLMQAIQVAEKAQKPPLEDMFTDVYDQVPSNLQEQERLLRKSIEKHPKDYPSDVPL